MQKTVYEMRIGVWSSDVCSSDLGRMPSQLTPQVTVVYWRDIPAQVIAKAGRKTAKVQLTERFEKAIDRAAMRAKLTGTDAYLEHCRRGAPAPCRSDLDAEAPTAARRLEGDYDDASPPALVAAGRHEPAAHPAS